MSSTPKSLNSYPEWAEIRSHVNPRVIEDWEKDFSEILVTSVKITDTIVTVNSSININFKGDREDAEKFVLYLLWKPKIK